MSAFRGKADNAAVAEATLPVKPQKKVWNFASARPFSVRGQQRFRRKHVRTFLITLTALGVVAFALPAVTANAQDRTVVVTRDGDHDRGLHRGWTRGHHYGWRNHNDWRNHNAKVVVIKKHRHRHYD